MSNQVISNALYGQEDVIDIKSTKSYAPGAKVKNMLGERLSNVQPGFTIANKSNKTLTFIIIPGLNIVDPSILVGSGLRALNSESKLKQITGADFILGLGENVTENVKVESISKKYDIAMMLNSMGLNPTRITTMQLKSRSQDGNPENTNYDNAIIHYGFTPYDKARTEDFSLRNLQNSSMLSTEYAKADFLSTDFPAIISSQDAILITVNANTTLSVQLTIGVSDNVAQSFFRFVRDADQVLAPHRAQL